MTFFKIYILNYGIAYYIMELHTDQEDKMPPKICVANLCWHVSQTDALHM